MKNKRILLPIFLISLNACNVSYEITSTFEYEDNNVSIKDTVEQRNGQKAHLVFLYGQSNAEGTSRVSYLENKDYVKFQEYKEGYDNVQINFVNHMSYTSNYGFTKCVLGQGYNETCFGPEVGIAEEMHNAYQNEMTFIIKWTWGGSILRSQWLDDHHNRGNFYNSAMDFSIKCVDYIISKGYEISVDGVCWMQGESDSYDANPYAYYRDTISFVSAIRLDLGKYQKKIKFIDAAINEVDNIWPNAKVVNDGKRKFSKESSLNYIIETNDIGISTRTEPEDGIDYAHYDSLSMVKLGQEFGKILVRK